MSLKSAMIDSFWKLESKVFQILILRHQYFDKNEKEWNKEMNITFSKQSLIEMNKSHSAIIKIKKSLLQQTIG